VKRSRLVVATIAIGAFALLSFVACDEKRNRITPSSEQAASDHAFERGWLPEELRRGATHISEFHDLDNLPRWCELRLLRAFDGERLEKSCSTIPPNQKVSSPLG